jgi:hypothetical protein
MQPPYRKGFSILESMSDCSYALATWYFRVTWRRLAKGGTCDDIDGAEYHRVLSAWLRANAPLPVEPFVRAHANAPAGSNLLKEGGK